MIAAVREHERIGEDERANETGQPSQQAANRDLTTTVLSLQQQVGNAAVARMAAAGAFAPTRQLARRTETPLARFRRLLGTGRRWEDALKQLAGLPIAVMQGEVTTLTVDQRRRLLAALHILEIGPGTPVETELRRHGGIQPGELFGTPSWQQSPHSAASAGGQYDCDMYIQFTPDAAVVDCREIAVIQTVQVIDTATKANAETLPHLIRRQTPAFSEIDRIEDRRYGFYGYANTGRASGDPGTQAAPVGGGNMRAGSSRPVRDMHYYDGPSDSMTGVTFNFETAIVARSGPQRGLVYSVITWGFDVDAHGRLTAHAVGLADRLSAEFGRARDAWNTQARGPRAQRNDPRQSELPRLR
jgi:hypothetical protein